MKETLKIIFEKKDEFNNDEDDWIVGQARVIEQQRKIYEINLKIQSLEEFNNNIIQLKKVWTITWLYILVNY